MLTIAIESPRQAELLQLLRLGDEFAASLYPADSCYMLDVSELETPSVVVLVARAVPDEAALGMVALVNRHDSTAEIKRMFVVSAARGLGVGSALMFAIEEHARSAAIRVIQLETGPKQPEAIALYAKHGYFHIDNFGPYVGDEFSVCMEKHLG
ncbi:MAG: GNAT family N-acetyltransferase [Microbacteriaceae bacterium]